MNDQFPMTNERTKKFDIQERSLKFAVRAGLFVDKLPRKQAAIEYGKQLIRSSASIGANLEEADGAVSKKDFINKIGISRKEARESKYWLKLIKSVLFNDNSQGDQDLDWLLNESDELRLILSSILNKSKA